ncbi:MAG: hypothetical protein EXQ85_03830 [Alphaproteobacteria bacterium]|nr:hypothetical protein [Alphaproteobacteria bacterium]
MRETILVEGQPTKTLQEFLRPGLRAVFVGINPSPVSVANGHYYQGTLGRRFWRRLPNYGIVGPLPESRQDEFAFGLGFGFADLVRRPTASAKELSRHELATGAREFVLRLEGIGGARPIVVFVFAKAAEIAAPMLGQRMYCTIRMPSPYAKREDEAKQMLAVVAALTPDRRRFSG